MPITAECPNCGFKGNVPDQFKGKKVKCRQCTQDFRVGCEPPDPPANGTTDSRKTNPAVEMEVFEDLSAPPARKARPSSQGGIQLPPQEAETAAPARKARPSSQGGIKLPPEEQEAAAPAR